MKIAICDDERIFQEQLLRELENYYHSLDLTVYRFSSGEELLAHIGDMQYDLLFLDIEMGKMDGLQTARKVHEAVPELPIVFLTSHVEFALEGYEVSAFRFLTKPLDKDKLKQTLQAYEKIIERTQKITIVEDGCEKYIFDRDIYYIKGENVYLQVVTRQGSYLIRRKFKEQLEELPQEMFVAVHRSYIVNLQFVAAFAQNELIMEDGTRIPVSKGKRDGFKQAMMRYMREKA